MSIRIYKPDTSPETLSVEEAAKSLRVSERTILSLSHKGLIKAHMIDGIWKIDKKTLNSEKYIITIATDLTTRDEVLWTKINEQGDGLFIHPEHQLDSDIDVYVTSKKITEVKEKFAGTIVYIVESEDTIVPEGHTATTLDRLPWTLRAIVGEIRRSMSKK